LEGRLTKSDKQVKAGWALFLDFDGTLIDIAPTPEAIRVPDDLPSILERLNRALDGALAIVTGRSVNDLERHLAPSRLVIAGAHGAELRLAPDRFASTAAPISPAVVAAASALSERFDGVKVEVKGRSIAVHYRANPEAGPAIERDLRALLSESHSEITICPGRKVHELVPAHVSKGAAIETLLRFPPFHGRRPLVIGDDFTDESAFQAAERNGGLGLRVAGEHFSKDIADFNEPSEVRDWLAVFAASFRS
jgi:trehalose 6-phosphate phosphatase